jgi:hypothetical protein
LDLGASGCTLGGGTPPFGGVVLSSITFSADSSSSQPVVDLSNIFVDASFPSSSSTLEFEVMGIPNPSLADSLTVNFGLDLQPGSDENVISVLASAFFVDGSGTIYPSPAGTAVVGQACFGGVLTGTSCSGFYEGVGAANDFSHFETTTLSGFELNLTVPGNADPNMFWDVDFDVDVSASPEPGSWACVIVGALAIGSREAISRLLAKRRRNGPRPG